MALPFPRPGRLFQVIYALALATCIATGDDPPRARAADFTIILDQARVERLPQNVGTIVIGNPLIADATVVSGNVMILTGKGYGETNLVVFDRAGIILMERSVEVLSPETYVTVVTRGIDRSTLSCSPSCDPRPTLGDAGPEAKKGAGVKVVSCNNAGDTAADGSNCGGRAASVRPGGRP